MVTKKQLANLRPIKKGEVRNPLGGKAHNPEKKKLKKLTEAQVVEIGTLVVAKNASALREIVADAIGSKERSANPNSKHSALKVWMASVALKSIVKGDAHGVDIILNRIIGKPKQKIEVAGEDGGPVRSLVGQMSKDDRASELARLKKQRKDAGED